MHICSLDQTPAICPRLAANSTTCSWPVAQAQQDSLCVASRLGFWLSRGGGGWQSEDSKFMGPHSFRASPGNLQRAQEGPRGKRRVVKRNCLRRSSEQCLSEDQSGNRNQYLLVFPFRKWPMRGLNSMKCQTHFCPSPNSGFPRIPCMGSTLK